MENASQANSTTSLDLFSDRLWLLALLLLGFALRLFHLGDESLWYDETVSVYLATQSVPELIAHTARDIHPPGYYLLLHAWHLLVNPSIAFGLEYLYSWPSLLLSVMVTAISYVIAKRCFGSTAATWVLALAVLQPVQIWSAQEVRMYAFGAFSLVLSLWAVLPLMLDAQKVEVHTKLPRQTLFLYPVAALLGVYTLYFFLFWLVILNFCLVLRLLHDWQRLRLWLALQLLVVIGWLPWIPTFIHQVITPPVPIWRVSFQNVDEIARAVAQAIAAHWVGHTPPLLQNWPWALYLMATLVLFFVYAKSIGPKTKLMWLTLAFGPTFLILMISVTGMPIYHVRYVATFAPVAAILLGVTLSRLRPTVSIPIFIGIIVISGLTYRQLWTNPFYTADDHRSAVSTLASEWRPGDIILVNAGWAYTALSVYWPNELPTPHAARPPALAATTRISELDSISEHFGSDYSGFDAPLLIQTGSVDGPSSLGWGLPQSDFYAISEAQTTAALTRLAATYPRIWHYRLYDTVSDPNGLIRSWLTENTTLEFVQNIPGRDFLQIERYRTKAAVPPRVDAGSQTSFTDAGLSLLAQDYASEIPAGEVLYLNMDWGVNSSYADNTALSLRLYDSSGELLLQRDSPIVANPSGVSRQSLALPIPADTIPGTYNLAFVLYNSQSQAPYVATHGDGARSDSPVQIGAVEIHLPLIIPHSPLPLATFDYIDLLQVELPNTSLNPGASFTTAWTWRPQASPYVDQYTALLEIVTDQNIRLPLTEFTIGGDAYPSSLWPPLYPLRQSVRVSLPSPIGKGTYKLQLSLMRATDGINIPARRTWQLSGQRSINVGELQVASSE